MESKTGGRILIGLFLLNSGIGTTFTTEVTNAGGGRFELFVLLLVMFGIV